MKLVFWSPHLSQIGTEKEVFLSAQSLSKYTNYSINIFNINGEWNKYKKIKNITIIDLFYKKIFYKKKIQGFFYSRIVKIILFFKIFFPLFSKIRKNDIDYIFIHLFSFLPLIIFLFYKPKKLNVILNISGYPKLNFIRKFLWKISSKNIKYVFVPTVGTYNLINKSEIFSKDKIKFLPPPVFLAKNFKKKNFSHKKKNYILSVGRLTNQKNHKFLLKAFKKIHQKYSFIKLIILGDGDLKDDLIKYTKNLGILKFVEFKGFVRNTDIYYENALCTVITSKWEDPGFAMIESTFHSIPVISSDCPNGPREFLDNGNGGYLYKMNDIDDFYLKIDQFFKDNENILKNKILIAKKNLKKYSIFHFYKNINEYL